MTNKEQTFSIGQTAKIIQFPGGQKLLFEWLRNNGYMYHDNEPYQIFIDRGWFVLVLTKKHLYTPYFPKMVTRVTLKGLYGLKRVIKKHFPICKPCENARS
jgi:phage antirepressor YoqD-like protein